MKTFEPQAYVLLRIVSGLLLLCHGTELLLDWPAKPEFSVGNEVLGLVAGVIEMAGGCLVAIGLFTRHAAFLCSGLMAVAYWMVHARRGGLPIENGGEAAVMFCFVFLFIWTHGSGKFSVDRVRENARRG